MVLDLSDRLNAGEEMRSSDLVPVPPPPPATATGGGKAEGGKVEGGKVIHIAEGIAGEDFVRGDQVEVGDRLVKVLKARAPTVFTEGAFYQYDASSGVFSVVPDNVVSMIVQGFAGAGIVGGEKPKSLKLGRQSVTGAILLGGDRAAEPDFFEAALPGVAFADAFVEVTEGSVTARDHSPDHRARFSYPFEYDRDAVPKLLLEFFAQVFRDDDDEDRAAKIALLQEYLGACLLGIATKYQRVIVFVGDGANGKSVFSSIAEGCMPPGSVSNIAPQRMGDEYRKAMLPGKLLNIVSELPGADIIDSEDWKDIVAGGSVEGRHVRQRPFYFKPVAGHIYSANRLPGTKDQSHGFWRRFIVVKFERIFSVDEQEPGLADRILAAELPAVVAWALAGGRRVLERGRLVEPPSSANAKDEWRRSSDPVRLFIEDCCDPMPEDSVVSHGERVMDVYSAYREWASLNGHRPMSHVKFVGRMKLLGYPSARAGGNRKHHALTLRRDAMRD